MTTVCKPRPTKPIVYGIPRLLLSDGDAAAVDGDHGAVEVARLVGGEEDDCPGDLVRVRGAAERDGRDNTHQHTRSWLTVPDRIIGTHTGPADSRRRASRPSAPSRLELEMTVWKPSLP